MNTSLVSIMAVGKHFVVVYIAVIVFQGVYSVAADNGVGELLDVLLERIESLEASDAVNKAKIAEMELEFKMKQALNEQVISSLKIKMEQMESDFKMKEAMMQEQINELETTLTQSNGDSAELNVDRNEDEDRQSPESTDIKRQGRIFRKGRDTPENEVAFYATHYIHTNHHLGANQAIPFQQTVTNIGHAYNNNTGAFVAPVDGTYVFHATVMGIDTANANNHMSAHFDVNGSRYSMFYVTAFDQSSQMLVITLKTGDTVSVENDFLDSGFVGQHYFTFSGFLLYQQYPAGAIVGK